MAGTDPSTAIGYVRVSTGHQARSGLGLESQRQAIQQAAARLGLSTGYVHEDAGVSGTLGPEHRPGLLAALADLEPGSVLLVAKRDRLARDVVVAAVVEKLVTSKGARIVSAAGEGSEQEGPQGFLVRALMDVLAQYEALVTGVRTKAALRARALSGKSPNGHTPFGYRTLPSEALEEIPEEVAAIGRMILLRDQGASWTSIARTLNAEGLQLHGRPFHRVAVTRITQRALAGGIHPTRARALELAKSTGY